MSNGLEGRKAVVIKARNPINLFKGVTILEDRGYFATLNLSFSEVSFPSPERRVLVEADDEILLSSHLMGSLWVKVFEVNFSNLMLLDDDQDQFQKETEIDQPILEVA